MPQALYTWIWSGAAWHQIVPELEVPTGDKLYRLFPSRLRLPSHYVEMKRWQGHVVRSNCKPLASEIKAPGFAEHTIIYEKPCP